MVCCTTDDDVHAVVAAGNELEDLLVGHLCL
jgi:hypothetical protein